MDPHLRTAALKGDLAALNHALDDGADPNAADDDGGCFPLIFAVSGNHDYRLVSEFERPPYRPLQKESHRVPTSRTRRRRLSCLREETPVYLRGHF